MNNRNKFQVVLVNGKNDNHQDFFLRVLAGLVKISFKNDEGSITPNSIMNYMARTTQRSINDKDLRRKVGTALVRGMENKLLTLKDGQFKLTKRARVVVDNSCKLWLKIPTYLPKQLGEEKAGAATEKKKKGRPAKLAQNKNGQAKLAQNKNGQAKLGQIKKGQLKLAQIKQSETKLGQVKKGQPKLAQIKKTMRRK